MNDRRRLHEGMVDGPRPWKYCHYDNPAMPSNFAIGMLILTTAGMSACAQKTVEYRRVPAWARHLGASESTHVEGDGTEVRWIYDQADTEFVAVGTISDEGQYQPGAPPPAPREETAAGPVLHCILPMHVVSNLRECLVNEEYDLIWEQLLSNSQRSFYEAGGEAGREAFERFLRQARKDLVTCLRRMEAGNVFGDVQKEMTASGEMAFRLHRRVRGEFPVYGILIVQTNEGSLKLHDVLWDR